MDRENRSDSALSAVTTLQNAAKEILVPDYINLRDGDLPFWRSVVRARASWNENDLAQAANLARCLADIERIQMEIDKEGDTLKNDRGTVVLNPKHSLLETLSRRSVALSRIIQVHAQATQGDSIHQKKKNGAKSAALSVVDNTIEEDEDDLLARPQ